MKTSSRSRMVCALALSGVLAFGCDGGEMTGNTDGGGGGGTDGGGGGGDDGGGGSGDDGGGRIDGGGGGGGFNCAAWAEDYCELFQDCHPQGLIAAYENLDICRRVIRQQCEAERATPPIPQSNGVADEAACRAARIASCDALLGGGPLPEACVPLPGDQTATEALCASDLQCGTNNQSGRRMYCRPTSGQLGLPECPRGNCISSEREGVRCNRANIGTMQFCDTYGGMDCVEQYDEEDGTTQETYCLRIIYGRAGDPCYERTERQCAPGLVCHQGAKRCMAALSEGQSCDPDHDLCDRRFGLTCQNRGDGNLCLRDVYVEIGAQCGMVSVDGRTEMRHCSTYAFCNTMRTPPVCEPLKRLGETCALSANECEPGLECDADSNTCVEIEVEPPTCD